MGIFDLLKKRFKKRFRVKRRWLSLGVLMLALAGTLAYSVGYGEGGQAENDSALAVFFHREEPPATPGDLRGEASVTVHRQYVCGEEDEALGIMAPEDIVELAAAHPDWEFAATSDRTVSFTVHVDDLSSSCKENSYIGVDASGNLTLFEGPPVERRALKTFFQLNIEHLESALPDVVVKQLHQGIRINDIAEYNSVLSTFSDYAVDETEKVMKPER
ncbi:BofC C-terminal domain-containing protein [Paenibacillus sp. TRM 82003]|nr:BofC C-terminal domain-containing protein [Paenibacillus sp. TRM 82003]